MFSIALATLLAVQTPTLAPSPVVPVRPAPVVSVAPTDDPSTHIDNARRALANGEFDVARREFVIAAALDRDAGRLPVEASFGLAHVLYSQSYNREAATTLDRLAAEAARIGDMDTEARALLDAVWLHLDAGQRAAARSNATRLRAIVDDERLSEETRKLVKSRLR